MYRATNINNQWRNLTMSYNKLPVFNADWEMKYFFVLEGDSARCLMCSSVIRYMSVVKVSDFKKRQTTYIK